MMEEELNIVSMYTAIGGDRKHKMSGFIPYTLGVYVKMSGFMSGLCVCP